MSDCYVLHRSRGLLEATGETTTNALPILLSIVYVSKNMNIDGHAV